MNPRGEPRGKPEFTGNGRDRILPTRTKIVHLLRKLDVQVTRDGENPEVGSFIGRPLCQTRSEDLEVSTKTGRAPPYCRVGPARSVKREPVDYRLKDRIITHTGGHSPVPYAPEMNGVS